MCLYGSAQEQNLCWRAENNAEPVKPNLSKPKNKTEYDPSFLVYIMLLEGKKAADVGDALSVLSLVLWNTGCFSMQII